MGCSNFLIKLSITKCHPDGTIDVKFTLTAGPDEDVEYRIDFDNDHIADSDPVFHPAGGTSSFIHTYAAGESHKFRIIYTTSGLAPGVICHQDYAFTLPPCCDIYIINLGDNNSICKEGEAVREVVLGVRNIGPTSVDVDFDYGDGSEIISFTIPAGEAVLHPPHEYNAETARTYTVTATVTNQSGCIAKEMIRINECSPEDRCAATITVSATPDDDCNDDRTRDVDFSIHNAGTTDSTVVVDFGDDTSSDEITIPAGGPPIPVSHPYLAESTEEYTATINIISPRNCDPVEVSFTVEECSVPLICPVPTFSISPSPCHNNRYSVDVNVSLVHDGPINAILNLNTAPVDSEESDTGEVTLSGNTTVPAGTTLNAEVIFNEPSRCPPITIDIPLPPCGGPPPESDCSGLCWTLAILIAINVLVLAAIATLALLPPIVAGLTLLAIALGIAITGVTIALVFCTLSACEVTKCTLMGFSLALAIVAALAIAMLLGLLPPPFSWTFLAVAGAAAATGAGIAMGICRSECGSATCGLT